MQKLLKGSTILCLTSNLPGPLASRKLAQIGASVIRVSTPTDLLKTKAPIYYRYLSQNQKVISLNLKTTTGIKKIKRLLKNTDLFITSVRPQSLKKLGLHPTQLRKQFPKLSTLVFQAYTGQRKNDPAHDLNCQAELGLITPPHLPKSLSVDILASEQIYSASLALLLHQHRTQKSAHTHVTLTEAAQCLAQGLKFGLTTPNGFLGGAFPGYGIYQTKDQKWVAAAALEQHFYVRLLKLLKLKKAKRIDFKKAFKSKTQRQWFSLALKNDLPITRLRERQ